ncbi:MAG: hypothetical protein ACT4QD_12700, partial [Acidobacteriota bacterium]
MFRTARFATTLLALVLVGFPPDGPHAQNDSANPPDLTTLFGPRGLTRDTNGDTLPDTIAARVIVPAAPAREDTLAAANLAARLGFETTAMSLPLVVTDAAVSAPASIVVPILIGRSNRFVQPLVDSRAIDLQSLKPGQGLIAVARAPLGGGDGVVIVGGDDKGTLAAATVLASRLPRLWNMTGVTLSGVIDQLGRVLRGKGVDVRQASITSIVVDAERRGIAAVHVRATVSAAHSARALSALQDLDRAHRRGLEPLTLNFAEVARTAVDVWADGRSTGVAEVHRSGLNPRTLTPPIDPNELATDSPGERGRPADDAPGARPGKLFDLSNGYSIQGWYGDVYTDLIPDRVETGLIVGTAADALSAAHVAARLALETT